MCACVLSLQSLHSHSLQEYDVTLGARLNTDTHESPSTNCEQSQKGDGSDTTDQSTLTSQACSSRCGGGSSGLTAISCTPTDNYNYFAKTTLRGSGI